MSKTVAPWGSWASPISASMIAGETIGIEQPRLENDTIYWIEKRPSENGRQVIVAREADTQPLDIIPAPFSARSRVHEYGGGVYATQGNTIFFVNNDDQGVYCTKAGETPRCLYAEDGLRFADLCVDPIHDQIICVCEDHRTEGEPENYLVAININGRGPLTILHQGYDFYASPALKPDGSRLAFIAWHHPNMPWDGTDLLLANLGDKPAPVDVRKVAGGDSESVFQPRWSPDQQLYFVSDKTGWWNLYRLSEESAQLLCEFEAEFGLPQWVFGMSTYAFRSAAQIICCYCQQGEWNLASVCTNTGELQRIDTPYHDIASIQANETRVVFLGGSPVRAVEVTQVRLPDMSLQTIKPSSRVDVDAENLAVAEAVTYPVTANAVAHAFYYAPANKRFAGPAGTRPPVIVFSHGGPTAATHSTLNLKIQFWTSRGFAVLDVNYRGSTGYGRGYREQLNGNWGVTDVEDCEAGVRFLAQRGDVDADRAIIRGSSAGGYTTLCALTFGSVFRAGASLYGIGDLETLVRDTHKFEARYLDRLVGPYPEKKKLYQQRSPIHSPDKLHCPVIFLQGLEDKVVPPSQAEAMVSVLKHKGIPVAYVTFEGEQHGFRRAATIARALEAELYFYAKVFGFETADPIEPVVIDNL